ncbi:Sorting and assembly machinery component 50 homolog A [Eumeta japonica]|uniref:Sorting and assembly machinery component 50 homolog A n=1 Tax=Eumeta variegata TaxID=151549 RepID=A0A4C1X4Y8_EUMVA|nr:Sorting and assembly machinery component 50 homolog A [Eumeta japonica]
MYWAVGAHIYTPLPFRPGHGGLGELFRAHAFVNAGSLAPPDAPLTDELVRTARVAAGAGVALRLGRTARLELNYAIPLRALPDDRTASGLQFGVGVHFL